MGPMIVSASRRCDLPAFAMDWFTARLDAGYCLVRNPFDARRFRRVPLVPESVECFAFWTRDPRPLLDRADGLERRGFSFLTQVTITGYPQALEPGVPATAAALAAFVALAARRGPEAVVWRYDPIILAGRGGPGSKAAPDLDRDFHLRNFSALAAALEGSCRRVVLSLLDEYRGTRTRLAGAGWRRPGFGPSDAALALAAELAAIARSRGMEPRSCAEPALLAAAGIEPGPCLDAELLSRIAGRPLPAGRDPGQRPDCRCCPSVDIGAYGACPAGCAYCYARRGEARAADPATEAL
ncbi:MAG: DUF1848 domain-containing protein [Spirochaetaceae bacterium]|nr:DUF1848 domain-containing protein [Spirochaetaceae bacterium]